jgi:xanthine/uracil/vitamin C permease (AzgA family)
MSQVAANDKASAPRVLDHVFGLSKSGSNLRTEFVAGLTTFLTMVYIVFVQKRA